MACVGIVTQTLAGKLHCVVCLYTHSTSNTRQFSILELTTMLSSIKVVEYMMFLNGYHWHAQQMFWEHVFKQR